MNEQELKRYSRNIILPEIGKEGQQNLNRQKVLVIGAGGLGCPCIAIPNRGRHWHHGIIDIDKVDESNLHRQILYTTEDIGKPKPR